MLSASALKVSYNLRPAKQVERRMLVDSLQILAEGGFRLRDYQYTGMGSLYFIDFILFHKLLGIRDLLSVEYDDTLARRVIFNSPFDLVRISISAIGDVIPTLEEQKQHLLWLDYDFRLNETVVQDVEAAAYRLTPGSVLLVTVDVKPPEGDGPAQWMAYFDRQARDFFRLGWTAAEFAESALPGTNAEILLNIIRSGLAPGMKFFPLFNFLYADGHPMLTFGGMVGGEREGELLDRCDFSQAPYIRRDLDQPLYEILVPKLTAKERMYIEGAMPCLPGWQPDKFDLPAEVIDQFREIYRFFPSYVEMLM